MFSSFFFAVAVLSSSCSFSAPLIFLGLKTAFRLSIGFLTMLLPIFVCFSQKLPLLFVVHLCNIYGDFETHIPLNLR